MTTIVVPHFLHLILTILPTTFSSAIVYFAWHDSHVIFIATAALPDAAPLPDGVRFYDAVGRFERQLIEGALRRTGGVQKHAAALLGLKATTLNEKIKRLGIVV